MGSDNTASPPTPPPLASPSPSSSVPHVPLPHPSTPPSKLALENQSLKRRLIQYASTLEKLTVHARREIDASARARDEALSSAASTASLRDALAASEAGMAAAQAATVSAMETIAARDTRIAELEAEKITLERGRVERDADRIELVEARERLSALSREVIEVRDGRRDERERADNLQTTVVQLNATIANLTADNDRLVDIERLRKEDANARSTAEKSLADMKASLSETSIDRDKQVASVSSLRQQLATMHSELDAVKSRAQAAESAASTHETRSRELQTHVQSKDQQAGETITALRTELDEALSQLADTKSELDHVQVTTRRQLENDSAVRERDQLRANVSAIQDELEQSTELLTRAAIDALSDKERIRKLEESLGKMREDLQIERAERRVREQRVEALTEEIHQGEKELVELRAAKRQSADELHRLQMHINEQESFLASKSRSIDELALEHNSRTTEMQKVTLDLSNARNALAKKENDTIRLHADYEDICKQLKQAATEIETMHGDLAKARRELSQSNDQIADLLHEQERAKATLSELQVARRQLQELTTLVTEKDEELTTMKRWYTNLKSEAGEASREKKRLSDMLSDVTNELKRANQELDILRSVRKDQEQLAARISHIGETSTRELSAMKQNQTEQARELAKNTVQEYHERLTTMQASAKQEIAETVTEQLRNDLMPHLMRIVDRKAKHMVHALAKHVESFTIDAMDSEYSSKEGVPSHELGNAESVHPHHTNVATASGASQSQFVPASSAPSEPPSRLQSVTSNRGYPSDGVYGSPAASHGSPHDASTAASATREVYSLASPEVSIGASHGPSSLASPAVVPLTSVPSAQPDITNTFGSARGLPEQVTVSRERLSTEAPQESGEKTEDGTNGNSLEEYEDAQGFSAENNGEEIETINIADNDRMDENVETFYIAEDVVEDFMAAGDMEGVEIVAAGDSDEDNDYDEYEPEDDLHDDEPYLARVEPATEDDGVYSEEDIHDAESAEAQHMHDAPAEHFVDPAPDVSEEPRDDPPGLPVDAEPLADQDVQEVPGEPVIDAAATVVASTHDNLVEPSIDAEPTVDQSTVDNRIEPVIEAEATRDLPGDIVAPTTGMEELSEEHEEPNIVGTGTGVEGGIPVSDLVDSASAGHAQDTDEDAGEADVTDTAAAVDVEGITEDASEPEMIQPPSMVEREEDDGEGPSNIDAGSVVDDGIDEDSKAVDDAIAQPEPHHEEAAEHTPVGVEAHDEPAPSAAVGSNADEKVAVEGNTPTMAQVIEILTGGGSQLPSTVEAMSAPAVDIPSTLMSDVTTQPNVLANTGELSAVAAPHEAVAETAVGSAVTALAPAEVNVGSMVQPVQAETSPTTAAPQSVPLMYEQAQHIETIASEQLEEGDEYLEY